MQNEIIEMLKELQIKPTSSSEYLEFKANFQNESFLDNIFNIIENHQYPLQERKLAIYALKTSHNCFPFQLLEPLFPLIIDETLQAYIVQLFIYSYDRKNICESIFPFFEEQISSGSPDQLIITGAILSFSEYIEKYKIRDEHILSIAFNLFIEINDLPEQFRIILLEIIIKQMLLADQMDDETINQDLSMILNLFIDIDLENTSILMIDHILSFINKQIYYFDDALLSDEFYDKLLIILEIIVKDCPLTPDQEAITTPLYYIIHILKHGDYLIPFEMLFPVLIISDEQFNYIENNANYSFDFLMKISESQYEEEDSIIDQLQEYLNRMNQYSYEKDVNEDKKIKIKQYIKAQNSWKCLNSVKTLNKTQSMVRIYITSLTDEYIKNVIKTCFDNINKSASYNLAILLLFKDISGIISFDFDPNDFETFDKKIIEFYLLNYCNDIILQKSVNNELNETDQFLSFMINFDIRNFAYNMISSSESTNIIFMFHLIIEGPREFVDPDVYVVVLSNVLINVLPNLNYTEDKIEILENIFQYLAPGESLTHNTKNFVLSFEKNIRELKSKSIFCLKDEFINAFLEDEDEFFGNALLSVIIEMIPFPKIIDIISEIIKYFAAGNLPKYISRHNSISKAEDVNEETVVDMSNYNAFFPVVIHLFQELIDQNLVENIENFDCIFTLFSQAFINIYYPNDETVRSIIDMMYNEFMNLDLDDFYLITKIESVLRIFIKYEKIDKLDDIVFELCRSDNSYVYILTYEISFVLTNRNSFSEEICQNLSILLCILVKEEPRVYIKNIICIFARVALSDQEKFDLIISGENIEEFICYLADGMTINLFKYQYSELQQRMIICFFSLFSPNDGIEEFTKNLLKAMIQKLDDIFTDPNNEILSFPITSSFGFIKEPIFYDDQEFLSHPMISASLSEFIHEIQADELFGEFFEKYPNL